MIFGPLHSAKSLRRRHSTVSPVEVIFWSALHGANFPHRVVLIHDRRDEIVLFVPPLNRERFRVRIVEATVRVMADRVSL